MLLISATISGSALLFAALDLLLKVTTIITADVYTDAISTTISDMSTAGMVAGAGTDPDLLMGRMLAAVKHQGGRLAAPSSSLAGAGAGAGAGVLSPPAVLTSRDGEAMPSVVLNEQWRADLLQRIVGHFPQAYR
jgi:hypothetical protein